MKKKGSYIFLLCLLGSILCVCTPLKAEDDNVLNRKINLSFTRGTIYRLLGQVSEQSGYLFVYDSKLINNEQEVSISSGEYTIKDAIRKIIQNPEIHIKVIESHILLSSPDSITPLLNQSISEPQGVTIRFITIEGVIKDRYLNEPIPFASIGIKGSSIGTVSNQNGEFRLNIPDSLKDSSLQFSHVGYEPLENNISPLQKDFLFIQLEPKVIPIQEVVVRIVNPKKLVGDMLIKRDQNYSLIPVYHTSFYREGVEHKKKFVNLTEAVFKVYKTAYNSQSADQVKLLKMRKITNRQERDTIVTKFKSGIDACLMLDIVKRLPDFLDENRDQIYTFTHTDIAVIDNRLANVISFEQKKHLKEPLYRGELYIDMENDALLLANFEINPHYVEKAAGMFVEKKSRYLRITPQSVTYTVSYKNWNGVYYINHIRGDLHFKIRQKKRHLFNASSSLHTWFEMVTGKTETDHVTRFIRSEQIPPRTILSDTRFVYDQNFWENFNVIPPEEKLNDAISKISLKIEETILPE